MDELLTLARDYWRIRDSGELGEARTVAHNALMDEMRRAGVRYDDREEAALIALEMMLNKEKYMTNWQQELDRKYHEASNVFPLMQDTDYDELKSDIARNGLLEPIWLHPDGSIIDGRNRHRACIETETPPQFRTWSGSGSLVSFVVSLNLHRRHLTSSQRAACSLDALEMLEKEASERQAHGQTAPGKTLTEKIPEASTGEAREKAAQIFQTNPRYVSDAKKLQAEAPDLLDEVRAGTKNILRARRELKERKKQAVTEKKIELYPGIDSVKFICGNFAEIGPTLDASGFDAIITDPPYSKEHTYLYGILAEQAARLLKPGGSLLAMCGQSYLPEVFNLMMPYLCYNWTVAYLTPGGQSAQLWQRRVNTFWKPVLWFTNGEYTGKWIGDVAKSDANDNDKRFHNWGQSESGMADLIQRFSEPNDLILDPFCGGGTTGLVCLNLSRRFIGIDVNHEAIETSKRRIVGATT